MPTLVEVKRGTDDRIRREVVGQMLDYAADAILHWPVEELRARFNEHCQRERKDPGTVLGGLIGSEADPEAFRTVRVVERDARSRPAPVRRRPHSDRTSAHRQMPDRQVQPAEVRTIELRQYEGQGLKTLVPIVLGYIATDYLPFRS